MASLNLSWSDIYNQVADFLGLGTSPTGDNLTKVKNLTYRAYRQFLMAVNPLTGRRHLWSFLKKFSTITTHDGTWKYQLPLDFGEMIGSPHYADEEGYHQLDKVSPDTILEKRAMSVSESSPEQYAVVPVSTDNELGTTWELWFWPEPDQTDHITFSYLIHPEKQSATTDYFLGGPLVGEVVLELALAEAELQEENVVGSHANKANTLLAQMMIADTTAAADSLGTLSGGVGMPRRGTKRYGTNDVYSADTDTCRY